MWILALLACSPDGPVGPTPVPTEITDTDTDTDPPTPDGGAADVLRAFAAGTATEADVRGIARTDGLPAYDPAADVFVFVHAAPGSWGVAGDFNGWEPEPMACSGGVCILERAIAEPEGARYKLVQGDVYVADPWSRTFDFDAFGRISVVRPEPGVPRLDWFPVEGSATIAPRSLQVYVPGSPPDRVLYTHDGQNLFDPDAFFGGWRLREAVGAAPILIVGIENTADRFEDYTHTPDDIGTGSPVGGNGAAYGDVVLGEIRDTVHGVYGTFALEGQMGSSLGGLISLDIARTHPGEVDFVASLSGTLGWGRFGDLGPALPELWLADDPGGVLFLSSGGGPGADGVCTDPDGDGSTEDDPDGADNYCENRAFADALAASGRTWDTDLFHWWEADAPHNEAAWADLVDRPLSIFAGL